MNSGQHHLHVRKHLASYPHPAAFGRLLDRVMYGVGIVMPLALIPQVIQVYSSKDVSELSLITWLALGTCNILWTTYGIVHKAPPIIIGSAIICVLQFSLVYAIVAFG